jgi:Flp pilus assembly protein TadG
MIKILRRKRRNTQGGQTLVEFAIIIPLMLMVMMAVYQFGIVYNNWVTLTDAARAGARQAAVSRGLADPNATAVARVKASATDLDQSKLSVSVTPATGPGWTQGADTTVQATYPYSINIMGITVVSGNLKASTTERIE